MVFEAYYLKKRGCFTNTSWVLTQNTEQGEHIIKISYKGKEGEQKINLEGEEKDFNFTIKVEEKSNLPFYLIIGGLVLIILYLLWRLNPPSRNSMDG